MRRSPELLALMVFAAVPAFAQHPRWSAQLPPASRNGLHAIVLDPDLQGAARADLGDIRLLDSAGAQVPYVLRTAQRPQGPERFEAFDLLRNEVLGHRTEVEIERPADQLIDELHVWIKPIQAEKRVRITGSDDRDSWYMVKDEHLALQGARGDPPHQVLLLRIPRSDYRYLRLTFNDSITAPMNVLGVGRFVPAGSPQPVYAAAQQLPFSRSDSARHTVLRFALPRSLLVERMTIETEDTLPFLRQVQLVRRHTVAAASSRHGNQSRIEHLGTYTIEPGNGARFETRAERLDTFELWIDNGDDRPLCIGAVNAQCQERLLLARLDAGVAYRLNVGDAGLEPPRYDMEAFAADLPVPIDTLATGPLKAMALPESAGPSINPSAWWVWAGIIALMAGMAWIAVRLLRTEDW
ncbi:MAG: hypothetical protein H6591_00700 [Flavobacteriales bacterium]|nr:hypothetical protein [Flavobacteriales bacterium]